jgi:hypothetical protein
MRLHSHRRRVSDNNQIYFQPCWPCKCNITKGLHATCRFASPTLRSMRISSSSLAVRIVAHRPGGRSVSLAAAPIRQGVQGTQDVQAPKDGIDHHCLSYKGDTSVEFYHTDLQLSACLYDYCQAHETTAFTFDFSGNSHAADVGFFSCRRSVAVDDEACGSAAPSWQSNYRQAGLWGAQGAARAREESQCVTGI